MRHPEPALAEWGCGLFLCAFDLLERSQPVFKRNDPAEKIATVDQDILKVWSIKWTEPPRVEARKSRKARMVSPSTNGFVPVVNKMGVEKGNSTGASSGTTCRYGMPSLVRCSCSVQNWPWASYFGGSPTPSRFRLAVLLRLLS